MTDWASVLNPEQCAAVTAADGPILVLAAAGTGKTRTLTHRVAYLIEQGVDPHSILLLTFTNRAAREMLERAQQLVGPAISDVWSGTFHHVCHRILRRHADAVGFSRSFLILDREEALSIINRCIKTLVSDPKHFPKKEVIAGLIGQAVNTQGSLQDIVERATFKDPVDTDLVLRVAEAYVEQKHLNNAFDFDDLLVYTLKLFQEHPDILKSYTDAFRYVLVDEYQDTNTIQSQIVDLLASGSGNLMAVGDDFQCIYTWRGADFKSIMEFPKRWPNCSIIKLERNYRSTPEILAVANACIKGNANQFQKTLTATLPNGAKPVVAYLRDAHEQSQMVMRTIQRAYEDGYRPEDIAVLYRSHYHAVELEMDLRRLQVDYVITSGQGIFESAHIKDVIAYLRLCTGSTDLFAFTRMMSLMPSVGPKTSDKIWEKLGRKFDAHQETDRTKLCALMPKKAQADWAIIDHLFEVFITEGYDRQGNKAVTTFLNDWYESYLQRTYDNADDRATDVAAFAAQFGRNTPVAEFLYDIALMTNVDGENEQTDRHSIHLSSVHQAKGLEWPVVIILWCNEEMFPSAKSIAVNDVTEERRLFYVAVTRAKRTLQLCVTNMRTLAGNGGVQYLSPSRFIKEIPAPLVSKHYGMY